LVSLGATLQLGGVETIQTITSAGIITLPNAGSNLVAGSGANYTLGGTISGNGTFTKVGAGNITFSATGVYSYTGGTTVNAGALIYAASNHLVNTAPVTVNGGELRLSTFSDTVGTVKLTGGTITGTTGVLTATAYDLQAGIITADLAGLGAIATKSTAGIVTLSGNNTFTGKFILNEGTIYAGSDTAFGTGQICINDPTIASDSTAARTFANDVLINGELFLGDLVNTGALTFNGPVDLGAAAWTITTYSPATFNGILSNGGFIKDGASSLTLGAINTYLGGTTLNAGTLVAGSATFAFGGAGGTAGLLTINGGSLDASVAATITNAVSLGATLDFVGTANLTQNTGAITLTGSRAINVAANTLTLNGLISGAGFGVTKSGAGKLILGGANTFGGGLTLSAGTLVLANNAALGTGTFTVNGGVVDASPAATITNAVTLGADLTFTGTANLTQGTGAIELGADRVITVNGSTLTLGGVIGGSSAGFTKSGAGTLRVTAANTYSGATNLDAGTLVLASSFFALGGSGSTAGLFTVNGGVLDTGSGGTTITNAVTLAADLNFTGTGNLTQNTGAITLTGSRSVSVGSTAAVTFGGDVSGDTFSLTKTGTGGLHLLGVVGTGTGGVNVSAGTLRLAGINTYTGDTTLTAGTLIAGSATYAFGGSGSTAGSLNINGGTLDATVAATITNAVNLGGNLLYTGTASLTQNTGAITLGAANRIIQISGSTVTLGGVIGGDAGIGIAKQGVGTLILSGVNTYTGGTTLTQGPLVLASATHALGGSGGTAGTFTVNGGTVDASVNATITNALTLGTDLVFTGTANLTQTTGAITLGASRTISVGGSRLSLGGVIGGATFGIVKAGAGTLELAGVNTYTGNTTLSAGTLVAGSATFAFGGSGSSAGTLGLTGGILDASVDATITNAITFGSNLVFTGTANLTQNNGVINLGGASRTITVNGSTLTLNG
jgi:autotransporter-associated beta strand protein